MCRGATRAWLDIWRGVEAKARRTYHVQTVASGCGRDTELALLLSRGGAQDTRAASESPRCEFGGHCVGVCEGDRYVVSLVVWEFNARDLEVRRSMVSKHTHDRLARARSSKSLTS